MLVSSGASRALPLGIVDKLESRIFEALSSSNASAQRSQPLQAHEDDEDLVPKREVLNICLSAPNPTVSHVDKSSARIEWVDLQRPASLPGTCTIAYELELKQVSAACNHSTTSIVNDRAADVTQNVIGRRGARHAIQGDVQAARRERV